MSMPLGKSPEATIAIDEHGKVAFWNDAAERLLGRSARDAIGKPCHDLLHGLSPAGAGICRSDCAAMVLCRHGEAPRRFEMMVGCPDGTELWLDVTSILVNDAAGPLLVHIFAEGTSPKRMAALAGDGEADAHFLSQHALTKRETDVLRLLAKGMASQAIERELGVSHATVRNHIQNLLSKLGVHNRVEAVVLALRAGLVDLNLES